MDAQPQTPHPGGPASPAMVSLDAEPTLPSDTAPPVSAADVSACERLAERLTVQIVAPENYSVFFWSPHRLLRWRGLDPISPRGAALSGVIAGLTWLALPLIATAVAGQWPGHTIWRWALIAVLFGVMTVPAFTPANEQWLRDFCADIRAIDNERDLGRLTAWAKRWVNVRTAIIAGLVFATVVLLGIRLVGGYRLTQLPVGSVVVLAMLLYASGENLCAGLLSGGSTLVSRRLHYRMYWQRPIDSAWIGELLRGATRNEFYRGCFVTGLIALTAILLPLDSDLLVPTATVVVSACYASVIVDVVPQRWSIQSIVRRAKAREIGAIQERMEHFGPRLLGLDSEDFAEMERLVSLSDMIRASPSRLRVADSAARIAVAVVIPTIGFVASVIGEHFAGRLFEEILW